MSDRQNRILIVDDDSIVASSIAEYLTQVGYEADYAITAREVMEMVEAAQHGEPQEIRPYSVIVVDMSLPDMTGIELIKKLKKNYADIVPIAITGFGTIESAVKAIRHGAIDYLTKPIVDEELRLAIEKAISQHALIAENVNLRQQLDQKFGLDNIVGGDDRMKHIYDVVESVASSKTTVLMTGESGTGKSLIARAIHRRSPRADKPFVEISCGSIPETLLESELFGHMKGAFTGAHADKPGRFLAAHGGTLFLDEINSASPGMQLKLLRV
ncbi:MAG: sigma 54-interacting transcriptional regulator, partial [Planctomycetota bacterium]|nr:sigma 54-interacting transcriptional regulator [Planctomycetota bacterium]